MYNLSFVRQFLTITLILVLFSVTTAKYLPKTRNRNSYHPKHAQQAFKSFRSNGNSFSTERYNKKEVEKRRELRNRMTSSLRNNPAENVRSGLSIRIGAHQIRHTADGIHVQLGMRSRPQRIQRRLNNYRGNKPLQNGQTVHSQPSRLTRIILMRNRNSGSRRSIVLNTSRGTQIHISGNAGKGRNVQYIINTGNRANGPRDLNGQLSVPKRNNQFPVSGINSQLPVSNKNGEFSSSNINGQLPVSTANYNTDNINNMASNWLWDTTTRYTPSTTEPEDVDLFP